MTTPVLIDASITRLLERVRNQYQAGRITRLRLEVDYIDGIGGLRVDTAGREIIFCPWPDLSGEPDPNGAAVAQLDAHKARGDLVDFQLFHEKRVAAVAAARDKEIATLKEELRVARTLIEAASGRRQSGRPPLENTLGDAMPLPGRRGGRGR